MPTLTAFKNYPLICKNRLEGSLKIIKKLKKKKLRWKKIFLTGKKLVLLLKMPLNYTKKNFL